MSERSRQSGASRLRTWSQAGDNAAPPADGAKCALCLSADPLPNDLLCGPCCDEADAIDDQLLAEMDAAETEETPPINA